MSDAPDRIASLVASRLCHDLTSPVGAIGNGLELLSMEAGSTSPEMALLRQSAAMADARLRFIRIAYGDAQSGEAHAGTALAQILGDLYGGSRLRVVCELRGDVPKPEAKLLFLITQCLDAAMPHGGQLTLMRETARICAEASATRWHRDADALWALLEHAAEARAATIQFPLAALTASGLGRRIGLERSPEKVVMTV